VNNKVLESGSIYNQGTDKIKCIEFHLNQCNKIKKCD